MSPGSVVMHQQTGFLASQSPFERGLRLEKDNMQAQLFAMNSHGLSEHPFMTARHPYRPKNLDLTQAVQLGRARSQNYDTSQDYITSHANLQRARSMLPMQQTVQNGYQTISPGTESPEPSPVDYSSVSPNSSVSQQQQKNTALTFSLSSDGLDAVSPGQAPFWDNQMMWKNSTSSAPNTSMAQNGASQAPTFELSNDPKDIFAGFDAFENDIYGTGQGMTSNPISYQLSPVSPTFPAELTNCFDDSGYFGVPNYQVPITPPEPASATLMQHRRYSEAPSYNRLTPTAMGRRQSVNPLVDAVSHLESPSLLGKFAVDQSASLAVPATSPTSPQARRKSKSSISSTASARNQRRVSCCEFVNFTAGDSHRILKGVAPSGSSKTKQRREREEAEKRRKMAESARMAIQQAGGDPTIIGEELFQ